MSQTEVQLIKADAVQTADIAGNAPESLDHVKPTMSASTILPSTAFIN